MKFFVFSVESNLDWKTSCFEEKILCLHFQIQLPFNVLIKSNSEQSPKVLKLMKSLKLN